jgi:hypothetical protein
MSGKWWELGRVRHRAFSARLTSSRWTQSCGRATPFRQGRRRAAPPVARHPLTVGLRASVGSTEASGSHFAAQCEFVCWSPSIREQLPLAVAWVSSDRRAQRGSRFVGQGEGPNGERIAFASSAIRILNRMTHTAGGVVTEPPATALPRLYRRHPRLARFGGSKSAANAHIARDRGVKHSGCLATAFRFPSEQLFFHNRQRPWALGNILGSWPVHKYRQRRSADHLVGDAAQQHPT